MELLKELCAVHAPSGNEGAMKAFILNYVRKVQHTWKVKPDIIQGDDFQDCLMLKFGIPRTAVFAHMDSIGFTVRYQNQLITIGSPQVKDGDILVGEDSFGPIECTLKVNEQKQVFYQFGRAIASGTDLVFKCDFKESRQYIQSCYLDNRLGVYNALKLAEELEHGLLVFSCWEEHGGGSVPYLVKFMYEQHRIKQVLISDITWVTDGVHPGKGVVVSLRDRNIPRKSFLQKIIAIADAKDIHYQLEVEGDGSSDGREVQLSPYPIDWCFIGAPESNVHSPREKVHKFDIEQMLELYKVLMENL